MKVAVLTSSRADYSIYYPLLKKLQADPYFSLSVIAFGTHLSEKHGYTVRQIEHDGFEVAYALTTFPEDDSPASIAQSMAKTITGFASVWPTSHFDLVFCLGDRYEMFAACSSGMPFNVKFAHIHGGEKTLGAIDDAFRHAITHMSSYHFTAAEPYRQRVVELTQSEINAYNVGSLSIDNLKNLRLFDIPEFKKRFHIDLSMPSILITFHPETASYEKNEGYVNELISALNTIKEYQLIITMPNADTMGNLIRSRLTNFANSVDNAVVVESFGTLGYLSCMKHCSFMLGNTSSGYIEASFFPKYVVDLGNRQTGRIVTENIHRCGISAQEILNNVSHFKKRSKSPGNIEIYGEGNAAEKICTIIKGIND